MPKVTVITPVYNAEKYLKQAIDSVLNQSYTDFEYLIINDGSTDKSVEIIQSYNDPRIRFIDNKINQGLSKIRNLGLELTNTEYLAWFDADDINYPTRLEQQVKILNKNKEIILVCADTDLITESGSHLQSKYYGKANLPLNWLLLWTNPVANSTSMFRTSLVKNNGLTYLFDAAPAEDYKLWCELSLYGKFCRIEDSLVTYRVSDSGAFRSEANKGNASAIKSNTDLHIKLTNQQPPNSHFLLGDFKLPALSPQNITCSEFTDLVKYENKILNGAFKHFNLGVIDYIKCKLDLFKRLTKVFFALDYSIKKQIFRLLFLRGNLLLCMYLVYKKQWK